jgi:phosphatidylglycerophosphate synthase
MPPSTSPGRRRTIRDRVKHRISDGLEDAQAWVSYFGNYVSSYGQKALLRHKYAARDRSLVLTYITDPLYCKWVLYFPTWLPPNVITLTGLSFTSIGHALLAWKCPSLQGEIPVWIAVYNAFAILAYQAFDAMDGKQARRTGSGSPLGMLFDHGCDALNTTIMAVSLANALQLGPTPWSLLLAGVAWAGFFTNTLEEYYTGELYLSYVNMPNEGLQMMAILFLVVPYLTPEWWLAPSGLAASFGYTMPRNHFAVVVGSVPALATMAFNIGVIVLQVNRTRKKEQARAVRALSGRARPACEAGVRGRRARPACEAGVRGRRARPACEAPSRRGRLEPTAPRHEDSAS